MLDVHLPHHKLNGFHDFLIHLLTISAGLLIATGLEAGVEAMHHRHQRNEARENIRQELRHNRADLLLAQNTIHTQQKNMIAVLDFLQARLQNHPADASTLDISFREGPLQDSAWRTAATTGALSYMDYGQVQAFSLAYKQQAQFEDMEQKALDDYLELDAFVVKGFDPSAVTPEDMKTALPVVRHTLAHLVGMGDVSRGTLKAYDEALAE